MISCALCRYEATITIHEARMAVRVHLCSLHLTRLAALRLRVQTGNCSDWYDGVRHDFKAVQPPVCEEGAC